MNNTDSKTYIAKEPVTAIKGGGIDASIIVGEEVVFDEKTGYYKSAKGLFLLKDRVENNPEYWEEKLTTMNTDNTTLKERIVAILKNELYADGESDFVYGIYEAANAIEELFLEEQIDLLKKYLSDLEEDSAFNLIASYMRSDITKLTKQLNSINQVKK